MIQQLSIEIRVFWLLVDSTRTIGRILGCINAPFFVALLLFGDNFLADFVEDFFFDDGKIAADVERSNLLLLNLFVLSFSVFLILLTLWHAIIEVQSLLFLTCLDLLSFVADLNVFQLAV